MLSAKAYFTAKLTKIRNKTNYIFTYARFIGDKSRKFIIFAS